MITKKTWEDFRNTGLLLIINQTLHIFGWAIVLKIEDGQIKSAYPARVKFRGFDNGSTSRAYRKLSRYMEENAKEINKEAQQ